MVTQFYVHWLKGILKPLAVKAAAGLQKTPGALTPSLGQLGKHDWIQHASFCFHSNSGSSTRCLFLSLGSNFPWHFVFGCGQVMPLWAPFSRLLQKVVVWLVHAPSTVRNPAGRFSLGPDFSPHRNKNSPGQNRSPWESHVINSYLFIYYPHLWIRGQLKRISSHLPLCDSQGSNSGPQAGVISRTSPPPTPVCFCGSGGAFSLGQLFLF